MYFYEYLYIIFGILLLGIITIVVLIPSFMVSFDFIDIETTLLMNVVFNRLKQRVKNLMSVLFGCYFIYYI